MTFFDDEHKRLAEEEKHARAGGWIALVLVILFGPPVCWLFVTYTNGGQILGAHVTMFYTYRGLDGILPGIPALAKEACELDRTQPPDYRQQHEELAERYEAYAEQYHSSWQRLTDMKRDTSWHPPPEKIPLRINVGKAVFCNQ
jgi:hypothetical protein